jgi:hypothetical protein
MIQRGLMQKNGTHPGIPCSPKIRFWVVTYMDDRTHFRVKQFAGAVKDGPIWFATTYFIGENGGVKELQNAVRVQDLTERSSRASSRIADQTDFVTSISHGFKDF